MTHIGDIGMLSAGQGVSSDRPRSRWRLPDRETDDAPMLMACGNCRRGGGRDDRADVRPGLDSPTRGGRKTDHRRPAPSNQGRSGPVDARGVVRPYVLCLIRRFASEHGDLADVLDAVRDAADLLAADHGPQALAAARSVERLLADRLLPHEHAEEQELYPALAGPLGGPEATATMSRAHTEIDRLARRISNHLRMADAAGTLLPEQLDDLRSCLYGLHAVLRLHFLQEEENYFSLAP